MSNVSDFCVDQLHHYVAKFSGGVTLPELLFAASVVIGKRSEYASTLCYIAIDDGKIVCHDNRYFAVAQTKPETEGEKHEEEN